MFPEALASSPGAYAAVFLVGLLFGSFANVCIYRWPPTEAFPRGRSVIHPGSSCPACATPIRWYDNVPIFSYLWLRGRCRSCGTEFSPRYLLVEAITGFLFVAVYHLSVALGPATETVDMRLLRAGIYAAFAFVLVVITFIDLDHKLILDRVTYPSIPIFYGLGLLLPESRWWHGLVGAAVGYGVVRAISDGYYYLTGREGLGLGDGKLLAVIGALLGWKAVATALFLGSIIGTVVSVPILLLGRRASQREGEAPAEAPGVPPGDGEVETTNIRHIEVPFGPFLAVGGFSFLFLQPWIEIAFPL